MNRGRGRSTPSKVSLPFFFTKLVLYYYITDPDKHRQAEAPQAVTDLHQQWALQSIRALFGMRCSSIDGSRLGSGLHVTYNDSRPRLRRLAPLLKAGLGLPEHTYPY